MTVLNGILSTIVYSPLIIIGLLILYAIAYGVWHYYETGKFPPMYNSIGKTILFVLNKLITPLRMLGDFLWWLIPVFPDRYRVPSGRERFGAWGRPNIARSGLLLTLLIFIIVSILIFNYGYPNILVPYSKIMNILVLSLGGILLLLTFIAFNAQIMKGVGKYGAFPAHGDLNEKNKWLFNTGSDILFYSIGVGLALAILGILCYLVAKYSIFSVTGMTILMVLSGLLCLFVVYKMLRSNKTVMQMLQNNSFLKVLFYSVFIIPCLFSDTVKFLYDHSRHAPTATYAFLAAEIILITLYVVLPFFQKYIYTIMPSKDNKGIILSRKITNSKNAMEILKEKIKTIKNTHPSDGKMIDERGWNNIISNNLNNPKNIEELRNFLINYGYTTKDMCQENPLVRDKEECAETINIMIKHIQSKTAELVRFKYLLSEEEIILKDLEERRKQLNKLEKGKILLMEPVYLKQKRNLGGYTEFKIDQNDIEYNYNYGLSAWFFIRAQAPNFGTSYNKFTSILNYGNKPNIMYNASKNTLRIVMDNGKNKKPIVYEVEKFPLQKWNNIVVNYDGGILDIFINSKLVASFPNTLPYMSIDNVTVGSDKGIGGGVCNVVYFPSVMSKERIDINYRLLKGKNPPVI